MRLLDFLNKGSLLIRVYPNAPKTKIRSYDETQKLLLVDIAALPNKGKVNLEVIKFFSKLLKKQQKSKISEPQKSKRFLKKVEIKKGLKSRNKLLIFS